MLKLVKVFYDYITIPKLGKVKVFEKGYIPQGKNYSNITFSHDGKDWWISLDIEEEGTKEVLDGKSLYVDFSNGGLFVNGTLLDNPVNNENYKRAEKRKRKLEKKLRRQSIANIQPTVKCLKTRTSKNMMKIRRALSVVKNKLENIRKDSFKKQVSTVARTKPKKLYCLSSESIKKVRSSGLTRTMRENHTLDFFNTLLKKVELIGTEVVRLEVPTKRLLCAP